MDTAATALSFHSKLQEQAEKFYEELARRFVDNRETFLTNAKEHRKHRKDVKRVYYYIITDAMDTFFAFEGMKEDNYKITTELKEGISNVDALNMAIDIERKINNFCADGANRSRGLLHDVPEALEVVARRTRRRIKNLQSLLEKNMS